MWRANADLHCRIALPVTVGYRVGRIVHHVTASRDRVRRYLSAVDQVFVARRAGLRDSLLDPSERSADFVMRPRFRVSEFAGYAMLSCAPSAPPRANDAMPAEDLLSGTNTLPRAGGAAPVWVASSEAIAEGAGALGLLPPARDASRHARPSDAPRKRARVVRVCVCVCGGGGGAAGC